MRHYPFISRLSLNSAMRQLLILNTVGIQMNLDMVFPHGPVDSVLAYGPYTDNRFDVSRGFGYNLFTLLAKKDEYIEGVSNKEDALADIFFKIKLLEEWRRSQC